MPELRHRNTDIVSPYREIPVCSRCGESRHGLFFDNSDELHPAIGWHGLADSLVTYCGHE
jgi:hypothetical protein